MQEHHMGGIFSLIGDTPLVELRRILPGFRGTVYAKLEKFNPGGSIKDRTALSMLTEKINSGELRPKKSVVVESSSGNLAIGIAQICRYYGIEFICVVDAKTTAQNIAILRAFGATIERVTEPDPETGEYLVARLGRVREIVEATPHAYWPNQYSNPLNPLALESMWDEIADALDGKVDYLFCAVSSCGTLRGCVDRIRQRGMSTEVVAVDAVGSVIFGNHRAATRLIPGHGSSVRSPLLDENQVDTVVHVSDLECTVACRQLAARESVLVGGSSGATIAALKRLAGEIRPEAKCVVVFPDGGERYLDTIYSDEWVVKNFGEVTHLWK
ncbi:2,3-diaminopropionate biosynthesis protein SbnA [Streptomyces sp. NPDC056580]|uniref:2,3-diaminopropionate biosynthesis protein SbnA n=1 Tax=Streptomyces sp. NPDC056580 TaxID=3345872 RepID=UPI003690B63D